MERDEWIVIGAMIFVALIGAYFIQFYLRNSKDLTKLYIILLALFLILGALGVIFYGLYENKKPIWWIVPTGVIGFLVIFLVLFIVIKKERKPISDEVWRQQVSENTWRLPELDQNLGQLKEFTNDQLELIYLNSTSKVNNLVEIYNIFSNYLDKNFQSHTNPGLHEREYEEAIIKGPEADDKGNPKYKSFADLEIQTGKRRIKDLYRGAWKAALKDRGRKDPNPMDTISDPIIMRHRYIEKELERRKAEEERRKAEEERRKAEPSYSTTDTPY